MPHMGPHNQPQGDPEPSYAERRPWVAVIGDGESGGLWAGSDPVEDSARALADHCRRQGRRLTATLARQATAHMAPAVATKVSTRARALASSGAGEPAGLFDHLED